MDELRFDRVVRLWARPGSRRAALRALGGAALGTVLGEFGARRVVACGGNGDDCALACPAGLVSTGSDFAPDSLSVGPSTCCPPERVFRVPGFEQDQFCCPAEQVCVDPADPSGWQARCCYTDEVCLAGACCPSDRVCGSACCFDRVCVAGTCVCPSGVICGGLCCPGIGEGDPFCGTDERGIPGACCYGESLPGEIANCIAAGGGRFGRIRP